MFAQNQVNTPKKPRVGLAGFAEYLSASPAGRIDCVRRQIQTYGSVYRPGAAFYKDFIDALVDGRRCDSDELRLKRCVGQQRVVARARHYDDLRRHWLNMTQWHLPPVAVGRSSWLVEALTVGIAPELALQRTDGSIMVVKLWLYASEPSSDAIKAMHRLLAMHMPQLHDRGQAAVLDLRRERMHLPSKRAPKKGFDAMLANEANGMGTLWMNLAKTA